MGRRRYTADFKRRVVVEAMRGDQTVQAIAARHGINPNQLSRWKTEAYDGLLEVFGDGAGGGTANRSPRYAFGREHAHRAKIRRDHHAPGEKCGLAGIGMGALAGGVAGAVPEKTPAGFL